MRFIPKRPTLAEIVKQQYGTLENYLNNEIIKGGNNGLNYHDIMLLMDVNLQAVIDKTGRNRRTIMNWQTIRNEEAKTHAK